MRLFLLTRSIGPAAIRFREGVSSLQSPNTNSRTAERETKCLTTHRCQASRLFVFRFGVMVMAVPRDGVGAGSALPCRYVRAGACDGDGGCVHAACGRCSRPCPAAAPPTTTASTTRPRLSRRRPRGSRNEREPIGSKPMPCISRANGPFVLYNGAWDTHRHRHRPPPSRGVREPGSR